LALFRCTGVSILVARRLCTLGVLRRQAIAPPASRRCVWPAGSVFSLQDFLDDLLIEHEVCDGFFEPTVLFFELL